MIHAVTFDCWQTLLHDSDPTVVRAIRVEALRATVRALDVDAGADRVEAALDQASARQFAAWCEGRSAGPREVAAWSLEALGVAKHGASLRIESLAVEIAEAALAGPVDALHGAHETLEDLRRLGVRTALICDTGLAPGATVRRLLERTGLLDLLETCVFSDEVGAPKPALRPFVCALDALGVRAGESIHVGDQRRTDVAGGRGAGMQTVRLRSVFDDATPLPEADRVADDHAHLRALLASDRAG